jgi:hypothetical protein
LDTRQKIVSLESIRFPVTKLVVGYFDPLWADNVVRLNEISNGGRITVVVADRADALLPLRARGELVAALSCVERVILCNGDVPQLPGVEILDEREADERRTRELSAHIIERYRPE